jgi:hypothetical protein
MYTFNAGQANAVLLKYNKKVLIVDFGSKKNDPSIIDKFCEIVKDATEVNIVVTHQHDDHYSLLNDVFVSSKKRVNKLIVAGNLGRMNSGRFVEGTNKAFYAYYTDRFSKNVAITSSNFISVVNSNDIQFNALLNKVLGNGIRIECLLPMVNTGKDPHDQNLLLKVIINCGTSGERAILLPGDCSGTLLNKLKSTPAFASFFSNVDVFLFPHHGSNMNGELNLYGALFERKPTSSRVPCLSIISSAPNGRDKIPTSAVLGLDFLPISAVAVYGKMDYIAEHVISLHSFTSNTINDLRTQKPFFITYDPDNARVYYKTTITSNGTIILQDGENIPQFCSFKADLNAKNKVKEIVAEIRKYTRNSTTNYCRWLITQLKLSIARIHNFKKWAEALSLSNNVFEANWVQFLVAQGVITDLKNTLHQCWKVQHAGDNSLDKMIDWLVQQIRLC